MPAAAVIPAPKAYTNIAALKALVVGSWARARQERCGPGPRLCLLDTQGAGRSIHS